MRECSSVVDLIRWPFHPRVTAVARKRPWSFCRKCRWQFTPKHAYTLDPTKSGWAHCRCPGRVWESIRKRAHTQLVRIHSVTVVSASWATVDWSRPKEWNYCARANLHLKKKKKKAQAGNELSNILPKSSQARKKPLLLPVLRKKNVGVFSVIIKATSFKHNSSKPPLRSTHPYQFHWP